MPLFLLALLLIPAHVPASPALAPNVGGRVVDEGSRGIRFAWPGVYFEGRFRGTAVEVAVEADSDFLRVTVDGEEKAVLKRPGRARLRIGGLAPGEHVVRLEKLTESQTGGSRFLGFRAADASAPLPARPRSRQIEFIGDSYTVGYGNASPGRTCTKEEVHDLTDSQRAFGPILARRLDADYRLIAYSGFGIVRNYDGSRPGESLPSLYERALPGEPGAVEAPSVGWRPQVIVINLGTNDFSTPLHPRERWPSPEALRADYRRAYIAFARRLMARQPQAALVLMGTDPFSAEVEQVREALSEQGRRVVALRYADLELTGCDYHPSLSDHRRLAALIAAALADLPDSPGR